MKKFFLLIMPLVIVSCSDGYKAERIVGNFLKNGAHDPASYGSVSFGELDSAFTSHEDDSVFLRWLNVSSVSMEKGKEWDMKMSDFTERYGYSKSNSSNALYRMYEEYSADEWGRVKDGLRIMDSVEAAFTPVFVGYRVEHSFRINNGFGAKRLVKAEFYLDSIISKVVKFNELD